MAEQQLIFIFGCQRSGTTATLRGLKRVAGCHVFNENNDVTNISAGGVKPMRLLPFDELARVLAARPETHLVLKPLVESQQAARVLAHFDTAVALWFMRDYRDVVASMLARWADKVGMNMLKSIARGKPGDWRSEDVDAETRNFVVSMLEEHELTPQDAAALFWYLRNLLYFKQDLQNHPRVRLVRYEDLVGRPDWLKTVLAQLGVRLDIPADTYHKQSVAKGAGVTVSAAVEQLCEEMMQRLDEVAGAQVR